MGAKIVILVGQDLAFQGNITHAGNGIDFKQYNQGDIKYVEDINGNKIKSRTDWVRYLDWFVSEIKKLNGRVDVIDSTEGGAKIEGTRLMNLSDAILRYCIREFDFEKMILDINPTFTGDAYERILGDILNMRVELDEIEKKSKYGLELSEKMLDMLDNNQYSETIELICIERIKKINEFVQNQLVYKVISDYMETKIKNIMKVNCFANDLKKDKVVTYELSKSAFKAILETVEIVRPIMEVEFSKL